MTSLSILPSPKTLRKSHSAAPGSQNAPDVLQMCPLALLHRSRSNRPYLPAGKGHLNGTNPSTCRMFQPRTLVCSSTSQQVSMDSMLSARFLSKDLASSGMTKKLSCDIVVTHHAFFGPWSKIFSAGRLPFAAPMMRTSCLPSHLPQDIARTEQTTYWKRREPRPKGAKSCITRCHVLFFFVTVHVGGWEDCYALQMYIRL